MEMLATVVHRANQVIEIVLGTAVGLMLLGGLIALIAEGIGALWAALQRHQPRGHGGTSHGAAGWIVLPVLAASLAIPNLAAAQGWWWGSRMHPGFDQSTVIQVTGKAAQVTIIPRGGPSTLRLETADDTFTVMLSPGWHLAKLDADIREGDTLTVEGSKMMDRHGRMHMAASRITNHRTGAVVTLRDETGRPRWTGGMGPGHMRR